MSHNPFKLGEIQPSEEEFSKEYRRRLESPGAASLRHFPDYWAVRDMNLVKDESALERRIVEAYGVPDVDSAYLILNENMFVTDRTDLFVEMYRHLRLDFVADFKSGLFFLDLYAQHETLMDQLFDLTGKLRGSNNGAEAYVKEGLGMFLSSQSSRVFLGPDTPIPDYFRPYKNFVERMD